MNKNIKISLIIPVYNTEKYLKKCLGSIIGQDLKDIEIICIDDGSTDNSLQILKEYETFDNRIIVMAQKNSGVSVARNKGMAASKGEFIMFVDSDDWIEKNSLWTIYNSAKNKNSDLLVYRNDCYIEENRLPNNGNFYDLKNYNSKKNLLAVVPLLYCAAFILYKNSFLKNNNILFPVGIINAEDGVFNLECIYSNANISVDFQMVYHYLLERNGSACNQIRNLKNELNAFIYTFNSKKYKNTTFNNKIITIEKYLKGILNWFGVIRTREKFYIKYKEFFRLLKFYKFLVNNVEKEIIVQCPTFSILEKTIKIDILSIRNKYVDCENGIIKRKQLIIFGYKINLLKLIKNKLDTGWSLKVFGIPIIKSKISNIFSHIENIYIFNICIAHRNILKKQQIRYMELCSCTYPNYDYYFTVACNCGELFLMLLHFHEIYKKFSNNNAVFVFDKKNLGSIYSLFTGLIDIPYVILEDCSSLFLEKRTNFKNKNFVNVLNFEYFSEYVANNINNDKKHYYDLLKNELNINLPPVMPIKTELNNAKIKEISKNILYDKFIIICPEASSLKSLPQVFWETLCEKINKLGYYIFLNVELRRYNIENTFSAFLTIKEITELAESSKAIIGLRSGLLEILSCMSKKPTFAIYNSVNYPKFKLPAMKMKKGFSLKKLPNINSENIYEYCWNEYSINELIYEIISKIENLDNDEVKIVDGEILNVSK